MRESAKRGIRGCLLALFPIPIMIYVWFWVLPLFESGVRDGWLVPKMCSCLLVPLLLAMYFGPKIADKLLPDPED